MKRATDPDEPELRWEFRAGNPDGGKDFGNANIYATPADLRTLVREATQNSLDAAADPKPRVHVRWTIIEFSPKGQRRHAFLNALGFSGLRPHIEGSVATASKLAARLRGGLATVETPQFRLLVIEDFGTTGLYGSEISDPSNRAETSPFAGLLRDNMNSVKASANAAGAFGLGKAVLWRCSGLSTVVVSSHVAPPRNPERHSGLRLCGKAELTWHATADGNPMGFAGPGWLGVGARPDSAWIPPSRMSALYLDREQAPRGFTNANHYGTSICVVGFADPKSSDASASQLLDVIEAELARNYWPALEAGSLSASVRRIVDDEVTAQREVDPTSCAPSFVEATKALSEQRLVPELKVPGDVALVSVPMTVPLTRREATEVEPYPEDLEAPAKLLVRLCDDPPASDDSLESHVALVRGRNMVVQYKSFRGLVIGGRRFHGVLFAGERVSGERPYSAAEQFLRISEPPAHDRWEFNDDVKEKYRRGAGQCLQQFISALTERLREVIRPPAGDAATGPECLRRLLQLPGDPPLPTVSLRKVRAHLEGRAWVISGELHRAETTRHAVVTPRVRVLSESGGTVALRWAEALTVGRHAKGSVTVVDGASLVMPPGCSWAEFSGRTSAHESGLRQDRCRVKIDAEIHPLT